MYNRYTPQPDGSYQRKRYLDYNENAQSSRRPAANSAQNSQSSQGSAVNHPQNAQAQQQAGMNPPQQFQSHQQGQEAPRAQYNPFSVGTFFKNLLPKEFDTGDLLILLLILLMTGDCEEDRNTAILTMALYLFL